MAITIADLKQRLAGKLHGTSVSKIQDLYGLMLEASGNLIGKIDIKETVRIQQITNAIYDSIYDYIVPTDLKEDAIIDVRPQGYERKISDKVTNRREEEFDRTKDTGDFTIQNNSGVKTLRLSKALTSNILLDSCNSITDNGTWAVGGDAASLTLDTLNKVSGSGSLRFNLNNAGSAGYIENSTLTAVDLSTLEDVGAIFVWVYIPNTTAITSIGIRWGSSNANYWSTTATTTQDNTSFVTGWNLVRFDWSSASETGSPVSSAVDYVRVTFNYDGTTVTACRVDNIIGVLGTIYNIEYFSKYLFKTAAGVWIEKPTLDSDILNLDTTSTNLFLYELAELCGQEIAGQDSNFDISYISNKKKEVWDAYTQANKSERKKKQTAYYPLMSRRRR